MNKISCDICLDLLPLVKDSVASEDSTNLVLEHIQDCKSCKIAFEENPTALPMNEARILRKMKNKLYFMAISVVVIGALFGIGLTASVGMFYNIIIMPLIGVISFFTLKKVSCFVPIGVFFLSCIWYFFRYSLAEIFLGGSVVSALLVPAYWGLIYGGLCLLGIIIGFLLKFAFGKEVKNEKNS